MAGGLGDEALDLQLAHVTDFTVATADSNRVAST